MISILYFFSNNIFWLFISYTIFNMNVLYPYQCCKIITACAVLHNIRKRLGMPDQDDEEEEVNDQHDAIDAQLGEDGFGARANIAVVHFGGH